MKTELSRVFAMKKFFTLIELTDQNIKYNLKKPSILLMNNIYFNWLQTISSKISRTMTVYSSRKNCEIATPPSPFGFLDNKITNYSECTVIEQQSNEMSPKKTGQLCVNIFVPQTDSNQYFIQWQRYRKYWWSSISTTPSLFAIDEINYENDTADANITANFKWGQHTVETITINSKHSNHSASCITCSTSLESALFILLLDGLSYSTKGYHFRLHRSMAPYKISFVINFEGVVAKQRLCELAELMYYKLIKHKVSSFLPNFNLTMEQQIIDNLRLGVAYTVILCETTLTNGVFELLNSNTMLREQVHLADFDSYTKILCK